MHQSTYEVRIDAYKMYGKFFKHSETFFETGIHLKMFVAIKSFCCLNTNKKNYISYLEMKAGRS